MLKRRASLHEIGNVLKKNRLTIITTGARVLIEDFSRTDAVQTEVTPIYIKGCRQPLWVAQGFRLEPNTVILIKEGFQVEEVDCLPELLSQATIDTTFAGAAGGIPVNYGRHEITYHPCDSCPVRTGIECSPMLHAATSTSETSYEVSDRVLGVCPAGLGPGHAGLDLGHSLHARPERGAPEAVMKWGPEQQAPARS